MNSSLFHNSFSASSNLSQSLHVSQSKLCWTVRAWNTLSCFGLKSKVESLFSLFSFSLKLSLTPPPNCSRLLPKVRFHSQSPKSDHRWFRMGLLWIPELRSSHSPRPLSQRRNSHHSSLHSPSALKLPPAHSTGSVAPLLDLVVIVSPSSPGCCQLQTSAAAGARHGTARGAKVPWPGLAPLVRSQTLITSQWYSRWFCLEWRI